MHAHTTISTLPCLAVHLPLISYSSSLHRAVSLIQRNDSKPLMHQHGHLQLMLEDL